jgi:aspartate/methionine/tyrosine aminotransferase
MEFTILPKSIVFRSLSKMAKDIFQPDGIFYWAGRSKKEAEINATIGTAVGSETDLIPNGREKNVPYYLPQVADYIKIEPEKYVAYAPIAGVPAIRKLWEDWIVYKGVNDVNLPSGKIDLTGKLTKPVICNGITNAIFLMSRFFLDEGESIISPNKRWGNYDSIITRQNGIKIESFEFFKDGMFNLTEMIELMDTVAKKQKKIVLILNFPNNPTGYTPTQKEIQDIVNGLKKYCDKSDVPVVVLCDDAYEGYVYTDDRVKQSIFYELVDIHPNLIPLKMDGSSKEMLMYGARIAGITLGLHSSWVSEDKEKFIAEWDNKMQAMIRSTASNCNHFSQEVLIGILNDGFDKLVSSRKKVIDILKERYDASLAALKKFNTPNVTLDPAGGGFFLFINVDGIDAAKLADHLLVKHKVGTIPIKKEKSNINGIRVAFCSIPVENIEDCFKRIDAGVRDLL